MERELIVEWEEATEDGRKVIVSKYRDSDGKVWTIRERFGTKPLSEVMMDIARKHLYKPRHIARWSNIQWSKPCRCIPMPPAYRIAFEVSAHQWMSRRLDNALEAIENA
ncbi:hypothetical protein [Alicyclobacillus dauci]|uniref:Uncharacterized protein n=1 Tax=Alicyclobacillus dauci TaxID=1475485 RepID=A0ABY6ZBC3_9BACL|nr:hypothetical protein [Alicyclobacillus dauci]WAH39509.1 hypothetical protein NZD86_24390 [Alicyclobacillus dauci]WAH39569.1 hypothetical protein NZD86_24090 [Alicyclobacillus dauci]